MKTNYVHVPAETAVIFDGEPIETRLIFRYNDKKSKEDTPMDKTEFVAHCICHHEDAPDVGEIDAVTAAAVMANAVSTLAMTAEEFAEEWNRQVRSGKTYRIRPEYLDTWGSDASEDTVLTWEEIESIARGWEKSPEELIPQLMPVD